MNLKRSIGFFAGAIVLSMALAACGGSSDSKGKQNPAPAASDDGPTIKKIKERGKLIVGIKYDSPPFGYLDPKDNQVKGFDADVSRALAKKILGDETKVELKKVSSADRTPLLQQGDIDLIVATMTITEERKKQIDFSDSYYDAGMTVLVLKSGPVQKVEDLNGKKVGTQTGATGGPNMEKIAKEKNIKITMEYFKSYPEAASALKAGQLQAMVTDNVLLLDYVQREPDTFRLMGGLLTDEPYGIGVKKGNDDLLKAVNGFVKEIRSNGEHKKLMEKWKVLPDKG